MPDTLADLAFFGCVECGSLLSGKIALAQHQRTSSHRGIIPLNASILKIKGRRFLAMFP